MLPKVSHPAELAVMVRPVSEPLMSLPAPSVGRILLIALLLAGGLGACGRRGAPEAPLTAAELAAEQQRARAGQPAQPRAATDDDDDQDDETVRSPLLTPPVPTARRRSRAYTIPKEPFILDPLL
jgi:predicted small lipoprotein YifL